MIYRGFKRVIDIIFSLMCMPLMLLFLIVLGPIIYYQDKGKIFYKAPRIGKSGKTFNMYKFRSMKLNSPDIRNKDGSTFNSENDPRLTKIGSVIRRTSIDEVPQIINILRGDMSLIGPRPELPSALIKYTEREKRRLDVRPGITGYSQAFFRNTISMAEKREYDIYYVENISLVLDLKIFFKTLQGIIMKKGIYNSENQNEG